MNRNAHAQLTAIAVEPGRPSKAMVLHIARSDMYRSAGTIIQLSQSI